MTLLSRLSLQKRLMLFISVWLVGISTIYTYISLQTIEQSTEMVYRERLALAQAIAGQFDSQLAHLVAELEDVGRDIAPAVTGGDPGEIQAALRRLYQHWANHHRFTDLHEISLVNPEGLPVWHEPDQRNIAGDSTRPYLDVETLVHSEALSITPYTTTGGSNDLAISITVPVRFRGQLVAYLISEMDLLRGNFSPVASSNGAKSGYTAELVDRNGTVLFSPEVSRQGNPSAHTRQFAQQLQAHQAAVQVHEIVEQGSHQNHIVAYAPLDEVKWGVFVEQEENAALHLPRLLRTQLAVFGLFVVTAGLATAWLATRSAVGPVNQLIAATRRIAGGDLEQPVSLDRQDEIGQLATAFEHMRQDLAAERGRVHGLAILEERDRLAREMHDGFAQALSILNLNARAVRRAIETGDLGQAARTLDELDQIIDQAYADVREAISSLRTTIPHEQGLIATVGQYLEEFGLQYGFKTELKVQGHQNMFFTSRQEIQLLRIVQEALSNVRKHAQAESIQVCFEQFGRAIEITIADDGRGFAVATAERSNKQAFGLVIMRERAESLNGSLQLETLPGAGTKVKVRIPLEQAESR